MKKSTILTMALVFLLGISGTAFAASFSDVPANGWAYDAVRQLSKAGLIDGYGDGTFRGNNYLTRYEFATITARAIEKYSKADAQQKELIDKLSAEFATELNTIGVRLNKLEQNASTVKFSGYSRLRYMNNCWLNGTKSPVSTPASHALQELIQLNATASINDKIDFVAAINGIHTLNYFTPSNGATTSSTTDLNFGSAYFKYKNAFPGVDISVGREPLVLGQSAMVADTTPVGGVDDIRINFKNGKISGFAALADINGYVYGEGTNNTSVDSKTVKIGTLTWKANENFRLTTGVLSSNSNSYPYRQSFIGASYKLTPDWTVLGDYVKNSFSEAADQNKGVYFSLTYKGSDYNKVGSWGAYVDYRKVGAHAVDGSLSTLCAFNSTTGIKGVGIGFNYTFAKNVKYTLTVDDLKSYDGSTKFKPNICTSVHLVF